VSRQMFAEILSLRAKRWLAMGGQIVDATVIEARRPRLPRLGGTGPVETGAARPDRPRRAMEDQARREARGRAGRRPQATSRDRGAGVREPRRHRPRARFFAALHDHPRGHLWRRAARRGARSGPHRQRGVDRHRLPLYDRKTPITAAELLNDRVIPFFDEHEIPLCRVLTDRGTEFCGNPEHHEYELYLAIEDIDHTRTKARSPQTNGICERFHKTVLDEFYRIAFRKRIYATI
jgi:hypothetical protein